MNPTSKPSSSKQLTSWCKHLRWKDYERDRTSIELAADAFTNGREFFTCLMTQQEVARRAGRGPCRILPPCASGSASSRC